MEINSVMIKTCKHNCPKLLIFLIGNGADNHCDEYNALIEASWNGFIDIIEILIKYGASITIIVKY